MRIITPQLRLFTKIKISNVWLFTESTEKKTFLVDCGHPLSRPLLWLELWQAGIRQPGDLHAVLLTHRHSDHAGNAAWLRKRFGCAIAAAPQDAAILSGQLLAPRLARRQTPLHHKIACHIEDRFPARSAVDELYEPGAWKWGMEITPVPGHTEGSVLLYHRPTQTLFSGDALLTGLSFARFYEKFWLAVEGFSLDVQHCHANVRNYLRNRPPIETVAAGHGPAAREKLEEKLEALL